MADLFDMRVGGAGWHITSHLIAIAALFVACFAIAGYITFRDDSVPITALNNSGNTDQDLTVNDITATGDVTVSGDLVVSGSNWGGNSINTFFPVLDTKLTVPNQFNVIFDVIRANFPSSAADTKKLLGLAGAGSAPTSVTLDAATDNVVALNGITIVNGGITANLTLNDSATSFAAVGDKSLILFNNYTMATGTALTIALDNTDGHDASASEQYTSASGTDVLTKAGDLTDTENNLILTATGGVTILKGSFIYLEAVGSADLIAVKTCLRTTGGTIAITHAA